METALVNFTVAMGDSLKMKWQNHAEKMLQDFADQYPENAKEWHEGLIRSHAESNVPSAKTAKIRAAAHRGGTDPNEKEHITRPQTL